ncbi:molybdopterin-binding/glycosyltransferase family 2 protein [Sandarakinorhabdus sp.]|uniref:molybdopterin-binding/glycosyltransferase family 2 protein n=1 Tax=Sandarakinorhabdus sp. TaxID=1916663 RepID=UPI003342717C
MNFGALPLAEAQGALLAHSQLIGNRRLAKGHRLTADDIAAFAAAGLAQIVVARLAPDDVGEDAAAQQLAQALAGWGADPGIAVLAPVHGRANLAAAADGLLCLPPGLVDAINSVDEAITLATLPRFARVAAGTIIATIKIIRYGVDKSALARAVMQAGAQPIRIAAFQPLRAVMIATTTAGTSSKALAKLEQVTAARITALGSQLAMLPPCPHDATALAAQLRGMDADILLVAGASASVDRGDVIPQAIVAAGGHIERLGMPVDPGNLLVLGDLGGRPVIGLPGCARSPKRNGFDLVLERLFAGISVTSADIAAMGEGGLLPEAERPQPRAAARRPAKVGAVVLAAGRASRMGGPHKLLETWQGQTLVAHSVDAIAAAGLPPPIVVLGHQAAAVRAALAGRTVSFALAADWQDGMGRSLAAGIAAVPADWDAVLVCLADMPRIEPALIAALAAAAGEVIVPEFQGRRGHPVRWPRAAFARLMSLAGDVGGRAIMADFALTALSAPSDACLDDIDTPAALTALRARPALP